MQIINAQDTNFEVAFEELVSRPRSNNEDVGLTVASIIKEVRRDKDSALLRFTNIFDHVELSPDELLLSEEEILQACSQLSGKQKGALNLAAKRIEAFHTNQLPKDKYWSDQTGIELGWRWRPINRVGLYVPGGSASYPSSVLMNAIPASIAGVKEIIMVTPSSEGKLNPLVVYAAKKAGVDSIYKIGGAQAVAALAYGTETVSSVDKIVGPGNAYVAEAKRQVFGCVGIDMIAGPSEVVVIADPCNNPAWLSADLLSQAEHDVNAQSILITTSQDFAERVLESLNSQMKYLLRKDIAKQSWTTNGAVIVVKDLTQACLISDRIAPEHLQLCVKEPEKILKNISNAGSVFLGSWTPEALGDYVIGTNHVLPTEKSARFASGLSVLDFMKRIFISKVGPSSMQEIGEAASILADEEGLTAHKLSVDLRIAESKR